MEQLQGDLTGVSAWGICSALLAYDSVAILSRGAQNLIVTVVLFTMRYHVEGPRAIEAMLEGGLVPGHHDRGSHSRPEGILRSIAKHQIANAKRVLAGVPSGDR